jgi:hypothetical protein
MDSRGQHIAGLYRIAPKSGRVNFDEALKLNSVALELRCADVSCLVDIRQTFVNGPEAGDVWYVAKRKKTS